MEKDPETKLGTNRSFVTRRRLYFDKPCTVETHGTSEMAKDQAGHSDADHNSNRDGPCRRTAASAAVRQRGKPVRGLASRQSFSTAEAVTVKPIQPSRKPTRAGSTSHQITKQMTESFIEERPRDRCADSVKRRWGRFKELKVRAPVIIRAHQRNLTCSAEMMPGCNQMTSAESTQ